MQEATSYKTSKIRVWDLLQFLKCTIHSQVSLLISSLRSVPKSDAYELLSKPRLTPLLRRNSTPGSQCPAVLSRRLKSRRVLVPFNLYRVRLDTWSQRCRLHGASLTWRRTFPSCQHASMKPSCLSRVDSPQTSVQLHNKTSNLDSPPPCDATESWSWQLRAGEQYTGRACSIKLCFELQHRLRSC
jgi:hypothetical protein